MSNILAAPFSPSTTQFVAASAASTCRRSASRNEELAAEEVEELEGAPEAIESAGPKAVGADATSPVSEMIPPLSRHAVPGHSRSKTRRSPGDRITQRSITFC